MNYIEKINKIMKMLYDVHDERVDKAYNELIKLKAIMIKDCEIEKEFFCEKCGKDTEYVYDFDDMEDISPATGEPKNKDFCVRCIAEYYARNVDELENKINESPLDFLGR